MSHDPIDTVILALDSMAAESEGDRAQLLRTCAAQVREVKRDRDEAHGQLRRALFCYRNDDGRPPNLVGAMLDCSGCALRRSCTNTANKRPGGSAHA